MLKSIVTGSDGKEYKTRNYYCECGSKFIFNQSNTKLYDFLNNSVKNTTIFLKSKCFNCDRQVIIECKINDIEDL